jgi:hypothetical protein
MSAGIEIPVCSIERIFKRDDDLMDEMQVRIREELCRMRRELESLIHEFEG